MKRWIWAVRGSLACAAILRACAAGPEPLRISVYATADDVLRHLAKAPEREHALARLAALRVSRVFLEGRRGDEYVPPPTLREVRDLLAGHGIATAGGIATVPGGAFGVAQQGGLTWLNWESERTRRDVAGFFEANAPLFPELIVDDFFCTGDASEASVVARGARSWAAYRSDLLVSLIQPLMSEPARRQHPGVRLIIKFPQWYDRFQLFGYDPPRMSAAFDQVWVGTEVRDPKTRRMGFVQPTEGYMNYRWLASVAGDKTCGAWFDHIECSAENFIDQAFQSVLAGARELTLFRLSDVVAEHPGDALLARRLPELMTLAEKVRGQPRQGIAFYKPPGSDGGDNLYLMDYLGMLGLPALPCARFPDEAAVVMLAAQAKADPDILTRLRAHLRQGRMLIVTPAFIRGVGESAAELTGVTVTAASVPEAPTQLRIGSRSLPLLKPVDLDGGVEVKDAHVLIGARLGAREVPFLTERVQGRGRVLTLNLRTFSDHDFGMQGEWLLSPQPRGLSELPQPVADVLRRALLGPLRTRLEAPAGIGVYLFGAARCLYNFHDEPVSVRLEGKRLELPPHQAVWIARP